MIRIRFTHETTAKQQDTCCFSGIRSTELRRFSPGNELEIEAIRPGKDCQRVNFQLDACLHPSYLKNVAKDSFVTIDNCQQPE